jgi:hypothetical protein
MCSADVSRVAVPGAGNLDHQEQLIGARSQAQRKAVAVWAWTLILLAALDVGLFVYSIFAWAGTDPGWF